jgi:hypothetical protein
MGVFKNLGEDKENKWYNPKTGEKITMYKLLNLNTGKIHKVGKETLKAYETRII